MGSLSPWHWLILLAVAVVLFGAKKLPDAARSLGKSMRIFKSEIRELQAENTGSAAPVTPAQPAMQVPNERVEAPVNPPGHNQTDVRPV
jgi:sec-independent protein translocase protein TatA